MAGLGVSTVAMLELSANKGETSWGYGIRYDYGSFIQRFNAEGQQVEQPDFYGTKGQPWEIPRQDVCYKVHFGGTFRKRVDSPSEKSVEWEPAETVLAMAYDTPIPGYLNKHCNSLRLWRAKPISEFDLERFNEGHYYEAIED